MMDQIAAHLPAILGVTSALLAGGIVKGVISLGLPLIALPLLTVIIDIKPAIALLMVPMILSNVLQAVEGGGTLPLVRRFTPLLLTLAVGTMIGTAMFAALEPRVLQLAIGPLAILFATASYLFPNLAVPSRSEAWLGPTIGFVAGVVGGMSTFFGPILAGYVVGLRLGREVFVKSIAIIYVLAASFLMIGGIVQGYATPTLLTLSCILMIPVYLGMRIGARIRHRCDPEIFRKLVLTAVCLAGINMVRLGLGY